jgi:hypothetical protein
VWEKRAKVFKEEKVDGLVAFLTQRIAESYGIQRCVLRMDLSAVLYLWEPWSRGKKCGELQSNQLDLQGCRAFPKWSKTDKQKPSAEIDLASEGRGRFVESAVELIREMEQQGHSIGDGFLFRPLTRQRDGLDNAPLSAAALRKRVQLHLKEAGLFAGETLHSFRRSVVQNAMHIEGYNVERLMELGHWKSYAAFRLYVEEIESDFGRKGL